MLSTLYAIDREIVTYTEAENNNGAQNNEYDVEMCIPTTDIATDSTIGFYILKKSIKTKSSDKSEIDLYLGEKYSIFCTAKMQ